MLVVACSQSSEISLTWSQLLAKIFLCYTERCTGFSSSFMLRESLAGISWGPIFPVKFKFGPTTFSLSSFIISMWPHIILNIRWGKALGQTKLARSDFWISFLSLQSVSVCSLGQELSNPPQVVHNNKLTLLLILSCPVQAKTIGYGFTFMMIRLLVLLATSLSLGSRFFACLGTSDFIYFF